MCVCGWLHMTAVCTISVLYASVMSSVSAHTVSGRLHGRVHSCTCHWLGVSVCVCLELTCHQAAVYEAGSHMDGCIHFCFCVCVSAEE